MSYTFGSFVSLFLIIVPGLIFRRFYYIGQFSKQLQVQGNPGQAVIFTIIPGTLLFLCTVALIYNTDNDGSYIDCLIEFLFNLDLSASDPLPNLISGLRRTFGLVFLSAIISATTGYISFILVRRLKLDWTIKFLRFKNKWYYLFSGEIFYLKNFIDVNNKSDNGVSFGRVIPYGDFLISDGASDPILYSGFIQDYDISRDNVADLERVYLANPKRYVTVKEEVQQSPKTLLIQKEEKEIPGEIFVLDLKKKLLNLNVYHLEASHDIHHHYKKRRNESLLTFLSILAAFYVVLVPFIIFINPDFTPESVQTYLGKLVWYEKSLLMLIVYSTLAISPYRFEYDQGKKKHVIRMKKDIKSYFIFLFVFVLMIAFYVAAVYFN